MTESTNNLFKAFENLTAAAWIVDCNERSSLRRLKEVWEKQKAAREDLIRRIEELEQVLAHDSAP